MEKTILNTILEYFKKCNYEPEEELIISMETAIEETNFNENDEDAVVIYGIENLAELQDSLTLNTYFEIHADGLPEGRHELTFTYCDNIEYVRNEDISLHDKSEKIMNIVDYKSNKSTIIPNPEDWVVAVKETYTVTGGTYFARPQLHIYVPDPLIEVEDEEVVE